MWAVLAFEGFEDFRSPLDFFLAALRYSEQATRQYLKRDERPMNREWPTQEQLLVLCVLGFAVRNLYQKSSRKPAARMTYCYIDEPEQKARLVLSTLIPRDMIGLG